MQRKIKKLLKSRFLFNSTKKNEFLESLKLLGKKTSEKVVELKKEEKEQLKKKREKININLEDYLEEIDVDKMEGTEILLSPLIKEKKEKNEKFVSKIMMENRKKINLMEEKKKKYNLKTIDGVEMNMEWFFKSQKEKLEKFYLSNEFFRMSEEQQENQKELLKYYNFMPEDIEHDQKVLLNYPGSKKGPRPEDDPESFHHYFSQNMSDSLMYFLKKVEIFNNQEEEEKLVDREINMHDIFLVDKWTEEYNKELEQELEEINSVYQNDNKVDLKKKQFITENYIPPDYDAKYLPEDKTSSKNFNLKIPLLPNIYHQEESDHNANVLYWGIMNFLAGHQTLSKNYDLFLKELEDSINEINEAEKETNKKIANKENLSKYEQTQLNEKIIPSIYPYYDLLPKHIRSSQLVMTLVVALEKHYYNMDLKDKQKIVNKFVEYILPISKADEIYAENAQLAKRKYYLSREDQIHLEDPDDKDMTINSRKKILLDSKRKIEEPDVPYLETDIHKVNDPNTPNPIDYYDNQDGFWDDYLKQKRKNLDSYPIYDIPSFFK